MIDLIENYESFYTTENDKRFSLKISDDFYEFLAYKCVLITKENIFNSDYTINFNLTSLKKHIYLCEVDTSETKALDSPLKFSDITALFNMNIGLNISITFSGLSINFPIFTIKKSYKFNKVFFKNLFKKKEKASNINIELKDVKIKYFDSFLCKYDKEEYKNVSFYIHLEKKIVNKLYSFFDYFCINFNNFHLKIFNPIVYFENNEVEDNIFFNIENAPIENFRISFIQTRLFFIIKEDNKIKLFINYIYLNSNKKDKVIQFKKQVKSKSNEHKMYYNNDDNTYMLNRILLAEYIINTKKTIFYY